MKQILGWPDFEHLMTCKKDWLTTRLVVLRDLSKKNKPTKENCNLDSSRLSLREQRGSFSANGKFPMNPLKLKEDKGKGSWEKGFLLLKAQSLARFPLAHSQVLPLWLLPTKTSSNSPLWLQPMLFPLPAPSGRNSMAVSLVTGGPQTN